MNSHLTKTYNRALGRLPERLTKPFEGSLKLVIGEHARHQAANDRYGAMTLTSTIFVMPPEIVELETHRGIPSKAVIRKSYDEVRDIVFVLTPERQGADNVFVVKTVWCNLKTDQHSTLNTPKLRGTGKFWGSK